MKAQLMSDLHTEFYYGQSMDMLQRLEFEPNLDVLFLVGDIIVPKAQPLGECRDVFSFLASKARYVLYTVGNHEYYNSEHKEEVDDTLRELMPSNFIWLDNSAFFLDGTHFYGGAVWFPDHAMNKLSESHITALSSIRDTHEWVYQSNAFFELNAKRVLTERTIVLTHHLPSNLSTPKRYAESTINRFFVSDETPLIIDKQPRLWVHGHTHYSCEYLIGKTKVVCNPLGYPKERKWMGKYAPVVFEIGN